MVGMFTLHALHGGVASMPSLQGVLVVMNHATCRATHISGGGIWSPEQRFLANGIHWMSRSVQNWKQEGKCKI